MGGGYGDTAPFLFFTSFLDRELAERGRRGRLQEFGRFGWRGTIPDPGAPATFVASRLNHALASAPRHRALREYYRQWLPPPRPPPPPRPRPQGTPPAPPPGTRLPGAPPPPARAGDRPT